ncbi:MAG TPA: MEKHLA domain-containing protein [Burkholderiales bacterium]|nr:MEKHLA domain-containing protein [Burkholderiales bacterium]
MGPSRDNAWLADHAALLLDSYERLLHAPLVPHGERMQRAQALYESPIVVVSHDTAADPVFNYANLAAQRLFELDWESFVRLPSRLSAGPVHRDERQRLLAIVTRQGYIDDYSGIRVASSGRQFRIAQATVWNVAHADGKYAGQAACFSRWEYI